VQTEGGRPAHVFHITEQSAFNDALELGMYETPSLKSEGFIHCSTRAQISRTAQRFFHGKSGLVLLCLETAKLGDALKFELADGELFPHCYGAIALEKIVAVIQFPCRADGGFDEPEEVAVL
jgi:uncharacterized protein (DUF952 family)